MTDRQVLVFGSFTEDEIRSMQLQPQKKDLEIIFGSFDSETLRSVGIFSTKTTEFHSPNTHELLNSASSLNVNRLSKHIERTPVSKVAFLEENGCSSTHLCDVDKEPGRIEQLASAMFDYVQIIPDKTSLELPDVQKGSSLSSSLGGVPNGIHKGDSNESIFKDSNGPNSLPRNFLPRGLVNLGNLCFLNATLQSLLSCAPFFELLHELRNRDIPEVGYPTLHAFVDFISDFDIITDSMKKRNEETVIETGKAFRPIMFGSILKSFTPDIADNTSGRPSGDGTVMKKRSPASAFISKDLIGPSCHGLDSCRVLFFPNKSVLNSMLVHMPMIFKNDVQNIVHVSDFNFPWEILTVITGARQEDAQEFLSFIMHQMHDELLKLDGQVSNGNGKSASLVSSTDESEDENWETVGPRKKTAITRTQSFLPSKLSTIFGGQLKSVVKAKGNKASVTIQPFLLLHLNIYPEPVCTIEDALRLFSSPETLEGYRTSAAGKAEVVTASKSVKILELPEIMVLHLMRFSYGSQGSTKLHKAVHFPLELVVGRELLASPATEGGKYQLVATITHHGRDPSKGHYTADARHPTGSWLHYDDASVTPIPENKVLHDQAYILFYRQL